MPKQERPRWFRILLSIALVVVVLIGMLLIISNESTGPVSWVIIFELLFFAAVFAVLLVLALWEEGGNSLGPVGIWLFITLVFTRSFRGDEASFRFWAWMIGLVMLSPFYIWAALYLRRKRIRGR